MNKSASNINWDQVLENPPLITVITPSYNQSDYLEQTLTSVLEQDYPNFEYIVIDGGSTDGSVEIIRKYADHLSYWVSEEDRGQSHAINKGMKLAKGKICGWLNSDDYFLPGALQNIAKLWSENQEAVAWAGAVRTQTPGGRLIYTHHAEKLSREEIADWTNVEHLWQPGCFYSLDAAREVGFLREDLHYAMDFDFWLRLSSVGRLAPTREVIAVETLHPEAKTQARKGESAAEVHLVQTQHGFADLAKRRLAVELQELYERRDGSFISRLRWALNLVIRPLIDRFSAK